MRFPIPLRTSRFNTRHVFRSLSAMLSLGILINTGGWTAAPAFSRPLLHAEQLLAALGYLPITWTPNGSQSLTTAQAWAHPPRGRWHWSAEPALLHTLWTPPGTMNPIVAGALNAIQHQSGLPVTGTLTPVTITAINHAWRTQHHNPDGYTYVLADEYAGSRHPETVTIWHNGRIVLQTLANTGVPQAPSPIGTWPVYLRYRSQTMSGITPWGTPYDDPGVPYVNYFHGGDAVHGFPRAAYGFPQSLGCVELPIPNAAIAWTYIHYGTPVTVALNVAPTLRHIIHGGPIR